MYSGSLCKISTQLFLEGILADCVDHFAVRKNGFFFVNRFQEEGNQTGHPAAAVYDIRRPAEFFYRFQGSLAEENSAQTIIVKPLFLFIMEDKFPLKKILILQEIHL